MKLGSNTLSSTEYTENVATGKLGEVGAAPAATDELGKEIGILGDILKVRGNQINSVKVAPNANAG